MLKKRGQSESFVLFFECKRKANGKFCQRNKYKCPYIKHIRNVLFVSRKHRKRFLKIFHEKNENANIFLFFFQFLLAFL